MSSAFNPLCCIVIPDITNIMFGSSESHPKSSKNISTSTNPLFQNSIQVETSADDQNLNSSKQIIEALQRSAANGQVVIVSSHDPNLLEVAGTVVKLAHGRVVASDQRAFA